MHVASQYRSSVAIPVLNGVVLVALFLPWFGRDSGTEQFSGLHLLFSAELSSEESLSRFEYLINCGCLAAWLAVITLVVSASLIRLPPRKWVHGISVMGGVGLAVAATLIGLIVAGKDAEIETGAGVDLLLWSLVMLAIAWAVRLMNDEV